METGSFRLNRKEKEILSIIREDNEGIALSEIAYVMDVGFVTIIQDVKRLIRKGLIKKRENKYFSC